MFETFKVAYHGTINKHTEQIEQFIDLTAGRLSTDFGQGFYVTNNESQAKDWARKKSNDLRDRYQNADPVIIKFKINIQLLSNLKGNSFQKADLEWAKFIYNCRKQGRSNKLFHKLDYVYGPLADGKISILMKRIDQGRISLEDFHQYIQPYTNKHTQLSFHTIRALDCITKMEVVHVD